MPESYLTHPAHLAVSDLPFIVAPKRETRIVSAIVNGRECSQEFPVFGCWLAGEHIAIREHEYQAAVYAETSRLTDALIEAGATEVDAQLISARVVSTRLGVPVDLGPTERRALIRHAALVASMTNRLAEESEAWNLRIVAAAIANRLPGCEDWDEARAATLPRALQNAIVAFMDHERHGAVAQDPEALVSAMAETLGKLGPVADSSPPPSTGRIASGGASDSGPAIPPSPASDSPGSRASSSSRRSKKASGG